MISMYMSYENHSSFEQDFINQRLVPKMVTQLLVGALRTIHQNSMTIDQHVNGRCISILRWLHRNSAQEEYLRIIIAFLRDLYCVLIVSLVKHFDHFLKISILTHMLIYSRFCLFINQISLLLLLVLQQIQEFLKTLLNGIALFIDPLNTLILYWKHMIIKSLLTLKQFF